MNKTAILFLSLFSFLILSSSCTVEKRKYQTGYHIEWRNNQAEHSKKDKFTTKDIKHDSLTYTATDSLRAEISSASALPQFAEDDAAVALNDNVIKPLPSNTIATKYYSKAKAAEDCDNIILANGEEIQANVMEVGNEEIRYKKCNIPDSPIYVLKRSEVFMIKYQNGTKDIITPASKESKNTKTEGFGLVSFIVGVIGLLIAGLPLGILALIFGAISLSRFKKDTGKYKGKGFAITGIILGLLSIIFVFILLASIL